MADCGLPEPTLEALRQVFRRFPNVDAVKLFGSRAKGSFHARSDIDLAVFGHDLDRFQIAAMLIDIEETDIPYRVDLQDFRQIRNARLAAHIERVGVEIYRRGEA